MFWLLLILKLRMAPAEHNRSSTDRQNPTIPLVFRFKFHLVLFSYCLNNLGNSAVTIIFSASGVMASTSPKKIVISGVSLEFWLKQILDSNRLTENLNKVIVTGSTFQASGTS